MPNRGNNLPSLEGQRYYMLLQDVGPYKPACFDKPKRAEGMAFSIRSDMPNGENALTAFVYAYKYVVTHEDGKYYVDDLVSARQYLYTDEQRLTAEMFRMFKSIQLATYYAANPIQRADSILDLLRISLSKETYNVNSVEAQKMATLIEKTISTDETDINRIDTEHVKIQINIFDFHNPDVIKTRGPLTKYALYTYVNIVYDCNTVCSQSVKYDMDTFAIDHFRIRNYGLLCMHGILEARNRTNSIHTTTRALIPSFIDTCGTHEQCESHTIPVAVSLAFATVSAASIFITYSNNAYVGAFRACMSRITRAISACIPNVILVTMRAARRVPTQDVDVETVVDD